MSMSNALVVSAAESASGRPLAVFGPQVSYFAPQILMEQDVHAPGLDARGAAFPGVNLYVQLGRGQDYSWSATSAGQDIIDTFAVDLCEPGGEKPTTASMHYLFRGECLPIEVLEKTNRWAPTLADATPAGSQRLRAERTKLGLVSGRATIRGKPIAYTRLRSTYMHEIDSARGFSDFNNPDKVRDARSFQQAAHKIGYTFNWLYVDDRDIAYFNSGNNPQRARGVTGQLPMPARLEWRGFDADRNTAAYTSFAKHPQAINGQPYITSWNNKQARGYAGADTNLFSSVFRSQMLDQEIEARIAGPAKIDMPGLVEAMGEAATTDLRAEQVLPLALRVLGAPAEPELAEAVAKLRAWVADGAHRRDRDGDGRYEHADAIRILDAFWPRWMRAQFAPSLGEELFDDLTDAHGLDNSPNNHGAHQGSAYQGGWYGYAAKDLRRVLGVKVRAPYSKRYCGGGSRARCRNALRGALAAALGDDPRTLYRDARCTEAGKPVRSGLLRHDRLPRDGRDHAADDRLAEPPDLPADRRSAGAPAPVAKPGRAMCAWVESSSSHFVARHEERDGDDVGAVLGLLEDTRERLEPVFGTLPPGEVTVVLHTSRGELDLAQPLLPIVRRLTTPAARRYLAGWAGRSALHVLSPRQLAARAANVDGSREMLSLTPAALYVQLVVAECNRALPPPWSAALDAARAKLSERHPALEGRHPALAPQPAPALAQEVVTPGRSGPS